MKNYKEKVIQINNNKIIIDVIAPSGFLYPPINLENITKFFKIKLPNAKINFIFDTEFKYKGYTADTKENRLKYLKRSLESESNIIWALRGGFGAGHLWEDLKDFMPRKYKILIGFSDITILHLLFNNYYNMPSIHGPVITQLIYGSIDKETEEDIFNFIKKIEKYINDQGRLNLFHSERETTYKTAKYDNKFKSDFYKFQPYYIQEEKLKFLIRPITDKAKSYGQIEGKIIGGNLTVFNSIIGTKLIGDLENKFLLLEDVNEAEYKLDRMFSQFKQTGLLNKPKVILLGDFTDGNNDIIDIETFVNRLINQNILCSNNLPPIYIINKVGHTKNNLAIPFNIKSIIDNAEGEYTLSCNISEISNFLGGFSY